MADEIKPQFDPKNAPGFGNGIDPESAHIANTADQLANAQIPPSGLNPAQSLPPDQKSGGGFIKAFNRLIQPKSNNIQNSVARNRDTVITNRAGNLANTAKTGVKEEAKKTTEKVARKAVSEVAKTATKQAIAWTGRAIAAATSEVWLPVLIIVLIVVGGIVAIAAAVAIGQNSGSSPYQASANQTQQMTLANAGNLIARRNLDADSRAQLSTLLDTAKLTAQNNPPKGRPKPDEEAIKLIDDIKAKLQTYTSNDSTVDQKSIDSISANALKLSSLGYDETAAGPAGLRIAEKARYFITDAKGISEFASCSIEDKTACNAFVIRVMHTTGVDMGYEGLAIEQYNYTKNRTDCYDTFTFSSQSQLAQGDIVFRPRHSGGKSSGPGHVGIYIGQGNIAAASLGGHLPKITPLSQNRDMDSAARMKVDVCPKK